MAPGVRLTCEAELAEAQVRLRYALTNEGDEPLYVYDDLGRAPAPKALCDTGDGAALVLVGVPKLPPFPVYWMFHPKTTALAPGASVQRELSMALPLRERSAYYKPAYDDFVALEVSRLRLRVDLLRASQMTPEQPEPRGRVESVVAEVALPRPVVILRRTDDFTRE